ncbi:MAG: NUDIX hydrolase [Chloroflexi bacterium]|nr:NUDIX hydrolase [Chloroflexota bacterium]
MPGEDFYIFRVYRQVSVSPRTGDPNNIVVLEAPDWVNVLAITPELEVVMIDQYRHGTGEVGAEIPGGMIDRGESPLEAGVRELREETGYAGGAPILLGRVNPNPAFLSNKCYTILIREAHRVGDLQLDLGEDIAVRLVPLADVPKQIANGQIAHSLVITAFHWLHMVAPDLMP